MNEQNSNAVTQTASMTTDRIASIRDRFLRLHAARLDRVLEQLLPQQSACLTILPLLLHANDANLPGYLAADTPAGMLGYVPGPATFQAVRQFSRQFSAATLPPRPATDLVALFLMGSTGSVAQSVRSDLDLWVCHRSGLTDTQLSDLSEKCRRIERWASAFNLELHLFLMNADSFRGGERETLNGEYCGSSQHFLLLDEFYRTGTHLAGGTPIFWYIPPDQEAHYDELVAELYRSGKVSPRDVVDFGRIDRMPLDEFLGAAMWQLYKGIDSPWKSLLKLMLLECYLDRRAAPEGMLCHELKRRVYANDVSPDRLDPYVMMYERIAEHLSEPQHHEQLKLAQQCLYTKVGITLSRPLSRGRTHWRRELMSELARGWGWTMADIKLLDQRNTWGVQQALSERHYLMREFTRSYRRLTTFAQQLSDQAFMKQQDMLVLGRKLQANFDRKPGKIDVINEDVAPDLSQEKVTIHELCGKTSGQSLWGAFVDLPLYTRLEDAPPPLKHARGFLEVLLWCHLNGLLSGHLHVPVFARQSQLTEFEVKELMSNLRQELKYPLAPPPQQAFRSKSFVQRVTLYANVGVDPMSALSQRGLQKISNRVDSLDFSAMGENLVRTLDMVTLSNWHEVVCTRYATRDALIQSLQGLFTQLLRQLDRPRPEIVVHCFGPHRAAAIAQRLSQLLNDMCTAFFTADRVHRTRYLLRVGQTFYLCQFQEGRFCVEPAADVRDLYPLLAREQRQFRPVIPDRNALVRHQALRLILKSAQPGQIVVCYQADSQHMMYWVHDEVGTLFYLHIPNFGVSNLLNHLYRFLRNVELQQLTTDADGLDPSLVMSRRRIQFFEVKKARGDQPAQLLRWPGAEDDELDAHPVQVMVALDDNAEEYFTVYVENQEFSSLTLGDALYRQVADCVFGLRADGGHYPCYITGLQFSQEVLNRFPDGRAQTTHYLRYKQQLERRLNQRL